MRLTLQNLVALGIYGTELNLRVNRFASSKIDDWRNEQQAQIRQLETLAASLPVTDIHISTLLENLKSK